MHHKLFVSTAALATATLLTACGGKDNNTNQSTPVVNVNKPMVSSKHRENLDVVSKRFADGFLKKKVERELTDFARLKGGEDIKIKEYELVVDGRTYKDGNGLDVKDFGLGLRELDFKSVANGVVDGDRYTAETTGKVYVYHQNFSMIAHIVPKEFTVKDAQDKLVHSEKEKEYDILLKGQPTIKLPTEGTAVYHGKSFMEKDGKLIDGDLEYNVDFNLKLGYGNIASAYGNIALHEGSIARYTHTNSFDNSVIAGYDISSGATSDVLGLGKYQLGFFGDKAQEISGNATFGKDEFDVSFGGQIKPKMYGTTGVEKQNK